MSTMSRNSIDQTNTSQLLASKFNQTNLGRTNKAMYSTMGDFNRRSPSDEGRVPLMGKTITNFAAVKYRDNGGLFPQSPAKLGLNPEVVTNKVWQDPKIIE